MYLAHVASLLATLSVASAAPSGGLASLTKIVLFMQENRAFDHYYGTMAGVRGFADPSAVVSNATGKPSFYQPLDPSKIKAGQKPPAGVTELQPWWFNHDGGDANERTQCALAGSNGWGPNHAAWNKGNVDQWANANTPYSLGFYKRQDIPFHFALAEAFTIGDAYHESIISSTNPNRAAWASGSINVPGGKQSPGDGGPYVDNYETDGCETAPDGRRYSCYPLKWRTVFEDLESAGVSWQIYQDTDNFDDNPAAWFDTFQRAPKGSPLANKGTSFLGLDAFYKAAHDGTLPQVSYIIGPTDLSEHPPYGPTDGAWLQQQVVDAVTSGPGWNSTALIISYDETGGWADHVMSPLPPRDSPGEWIVDPFTPSLGLQPSGPGFRVPLVIASPFTRRGGVFVEPASHESQILFLEKWTAAVGKPFVSGQISDWRRQQMSDLVRAFDFSAGDVSVPSLPGVRKASQDPVTGKYNGAAVCQAKYPDAQPSIPYGKQNGEFLAVERGFKALRGNPSEGRYLVFEAQGKALGYDGDRLALTAATADHSSPTQRFVLHAVLPQPKNQLFTLSTAEAKPRFVSDGGNLVADASKAIQVKIQDLGNGKGYAAVNARGGVPLVPGLPKDAAFKIFSVSY